MENLKLELTHQINLNVTSIQNKVSELKID